MVPPHHPGLRIERRLTGAKQPKTLKACRRFGQERSDVPRRGEEAGGASESIFKPFETAEKPAAFRIRMPSEFGEILPPTPFRRRRLHVDAKMQGKRREWQDESASEHTFCSALVDIKRLQRIISASVQSTDSRPGAWADMHTADRENACFIEVCES